MCEHFVLVVLTIVSLSYSFLSALLTLLRIKASLRCEKGGPVALISKSIL